MRKLLKHVRNLDRTDAWIFIKNTTVAALYSSIFPLIIKTIYSVMGDSVEAFLEKNARLFNCTYQLDPLKLNCLTEFKQSALNNKLNEHFDDQELLKIIFYYCLPTIITFIYWLSAANKIKNRHLKWMRYEIQESKSNISNLAELEEKSRNYEKYNSLYNELKGLHPIYLCDEKRRLLRPPAIGSDQGTAYGFEEFKQLATTKKHSGHGIIDLQLTEQIINYLENKPLNFNILPYKIYPLWRRALFFCSNFSEKILHGIFHTFKSDLAINSAICLFMFFFVNFFHFVIKHSNNPELTILDVVSIKSDPINFGFKFLLSIALTIALRIFEDIDCVIDALLDLFNNIEVPVVDSQAQIPFLFLCPITHLPLEKAVLCEDGRVYSEEALDRALTIKMESPITRQKFTGYPLIFSYNQRQKQVDKYLKDLQIR